MDGLQREFLTCKCGAPIEINPGTQDLAKPVKCLYCGSVITLRERQDDAQKIKQELKAWVETLLMGGGSSAVDVQSRHHIFNERTYPELKSSIDLYLENVEDVFEGPMLSLQPMTDFSNYQPSPVLAAIGRGDNQRLKLLSASVSAREIQDFAVMPADRLKLRQLHVRLQGIIYHANIARQLAQSSAGSYKIVRQNLAGLRAEYQEHVRDIVDDDCYRSYILALDARLGGDIQFLNVLVTALEEGDGMAPEATLTRLSRAITQPVEFRLFYERLARYIHGLTQIQSAGDAAVPVLLDWSWLELAMESTRHTSLFGLGSEKTQALLQYYHPYWVVEVKYAGTGGPFRKNGVPRDGLILVDATSPDTPVGVFLRDGDPPFPLLRASIRASYSHFLDKQAMALPALVRRDMADRSVKAYARQQAELKITSIRVRRVVYLPAASVQYTGRRQSRESVVGALNGINQNLGNLLKQTQQFLRTYNS